MTELQKSNCEYIVQLFKRTAIMGDMNRGFIVYILTDVIRTMEEEGEEKIWKELIQRVEYYQEDWIRAWKNYRNILTVESFRNWLEYLISVYHDLCLFVGIYELTGEWREYQVDVSVKGHFGPAEEAKQLEFNLEEA